MKRQEWVLKRGCGDDGMPFRFNSFYTALVAIAAELEEEVENFRVMVDCHKIGSLRLYLASGDCVGTIEQS
jgi:hypothetical protein